MNKSIILLLAVSLFGCSNSGSSNIKSVTNTQDKLEDLELKVASRTLCHKQLSHINTLKNANRSVYADRVTNSRRIKNLSAMYNYLCK